MLKTTWWNHTKHSRSLISLICPLMHTGERKHHHLRWDFSDLISSSFWFYSPLLMLSKKLHVSCLSHILSWPNSLFLLYSCLREPERWEERGEQRQREKEETMSGIIHRASEEICTWLNAALVDKRVISQPVFFEPDSALRRFWTGCNQSVMWKNYLDQFLSVVIL